MSSNDLSITLLTFNRPIHTAKVLASMKEEKVERINIYMDAPCTQQDTLLQSQLEEMYKRIDWADVQLIKREENLGLAVSIVSAITEQLEIHEKIIVLEDDCCVRPGFFRFMTKALKKYAANAQIRSVSGYQFPFVEKHRKKITEIALHRFNPWGWGTWNDRWKDYSVDLKKIVELVKANGTYDLLGKDQQTYCEEKYFLEKKADIWSINWDLLHYLTETFSISPSRTLIDNIGFDGTGVHSQATNVFNVKKYDSITKEFPIFLSEYPACDKKVEIQVNKFMEMNSRKAMIKLQDATSKSTYTSF